ncbi:LOW QUALITY PROTEIN: hypothetical protein HID58_017293, partial [Brassica napus]
EREQREKLDLLWVPAVGRRVSVRAGAGSGSLSSFLRRPGNVRFVRALIPAPSLTVGRCWSNDAFVGRSSVERESEVVFFREVEASADPPSPALASGKGVSVRFAFAGFWLRRAEASKAPRCRLGTRVSLGKGSICIKSGVVVVKGWVTVVENLVEDEALRRGDDSQGKKERSEEISRFDGSLRRDDMAVKRGYGFVGGLPVSELRRTRMTMVFIPAAFWRSGQVEAVTPRDA